MAISFLKKYVWLINLILIALLAYVVARIITVRLGDRFSTLPPEAKASPQNYKKIGRFSRTASIKNYNIINKRDIFGLKSISTKPAKSIPEGLPQTTLKLELLATVLKPGLESIAVFKNYETGKIRSYIEEDTIDLIKSERVKLARIENCIVVLERRDEGNETIRCQKEFEGSSTKVAGLRGSRLNSRTTNTNKKDFKKSKQTQGVREIEEGVFEIDQRMFDELLSNSNDLFTKARVVPQKDGLRFFAIRRNSIFYNIGIKNGDIVHRINNVELNNIENALTVFDELKGESKFQIDLTRRGKKITQEYNVR